MGALKNRKQAAEYLAVSESFVAKKARDGEISVIVIAGAYRFSIEDLDDYARRCRRPAEVDA